MYKVNAEDYLKLLNGEKIKKKRANVDAQARRLEDDPNGSPSIVNSSSEENILYNNKNVKVERPAKSGALFNPTGYNLGTGRSERHDR